MTNSFKKDDNRKKITVLFVVIAMTFMATIRFEYYKCCSPSSCKQTKCISSIY